jgi:hypothetical protein
MWADTQIRHPGVCWLVRNNATCHCDEAERSGDEGAIWLFDAAGDGFHRALTAVQENARLVMPA